MINFRIFLLSSKATADGGGGVGWRGGREIEIQKLEYLKNKKNFLDEIKSFFHNYLRTIIW